MTSQPHVCMFIYLYVFAPLILCAGVSREEVQGKALNDLVKRLDGTPLPSDADMAHIAKLEDFKVSIPCVACVALCEARHTQKQVLLVVLDRDCKMQLNAV